MPITAAAFMPHPPLIIPEVGRGEEKQIQSITEACRSAAQFLLSGSGGARPAAIVLISPHATSYADYFHISPGRGAQGDFSRFSAPAVRIAAQYDVGLAEAIAKAAQAAGLPAGGQGEKDASLDHGTMIPLYFLQQAAKLQAIDVPPIVRIGLSGLSSLEHYRFGQCIAAASGERPIAVLASGDLSHRLKADGPYGFRPEGPQLDAAITGILQSGEFSNLLTIPASLRERGAECGLGSLLILVGALDGRAVQARLLGYADTFGVGYAVATMLPGAQDAARRFGEAAEHAERTMLQEKRQGESPWVQLARSTIEAYIMKHSKPPLPKGLPDAFYSQKAGVFVSLHKHGALRGCIGTIAPQAQSMGEEIMENAISAATADSRFDPVQAHELPLLDIKVDVLGEPEDIASIDALNPKIYGVIVSCGYRRGLLLPDLEGIDTAEEQVDIARRKAGIRPGEPVQLQRFTVTRYT